MEDYEIHWGRRARSTITPSRHMRAVSAGPVDADEIGGLDGYFLNSGLYRAKRALSEARDLLRESSSMARESSVMESVESSKQKRSQLERIQEASSEMKSSAAGSYKITVTPNVNETWSTSLPNREWISPNTALTAKLLDAYNPSKYPDFIFGKYTSGGDKLHKPISATMSYMNEGAGGVFFDREAFKRSSAPTAAIADSASSSRYHSSALHSSSALEDNSHKTSAASRATSRARSLARDYNYDSSNAQDLSSSSFRNSSLYDRGSSVYADRSSSSAYDQQRSSAAAAADRYYKNNYSGSYDPSTDSAYLGNKARRMFKYYHLLIPKHYPGTPMLGGYLLPNSSQYTWRY